MPLLLIYKTPYIPHNISKKKCGVMRIKRKLLFAASAILLACSIYGIGQALAKEPTLKLTNVELSNVSGTASVSNIDYSDGAINTAITFHQLNDSVNFTVKFQNDDIYDYLLKDIELSSNNLQNIEYSFTGVGDTFTSSNNQSITISASYITPISDLSEREVSDTASFIFVFERIENAKSPITLDDITPYVIVFAISVVGIIIAIIGKKSLKGKSCIALIVVCAALTCYTANADGDTCLTLNATIDYNLASHVSIQYDYVTNGGESTTGEDAILSYGKNIDLSPSATKTSWNFIGWNTDKDAHSALDELSANTDIILYAIYAKQPTATFEANNNTLDGATSQSCTFYNNDTSCEIDVPTIIVSAPSEVIGYTRSADDHSATNAFYSETYDLSTDETFYAQSQKQAITRTINWDANGATLTWTGEGNCVIPATYNNTEQATSCVANMPGIMTSNASYTYSGYSQDSEDTEPRMSSPNYSTGGNIEITEELNNTTWYAIYKRQFNVTLYANGTTLWSQPSSIYEGPILWNSPYTTRCTATNITKTCTVKVPYMTATAIGYSTSPNNWENLEIVGHGVEYTPTRSIVLYTQSYRPYQSRDIQWVSNGATLSSSEGVTCEFPEVHNSSTTQTCVVQPPVVTPPEGYEFVGWNTSNTTSSTNLYNKETNELTIRRRSGDEDDNYYVILRKID